MKSQIITITKTAEDYLAKLISEKNEPGTAVRVFITDPGTPHAETCLAYCKPDELTPSDVLISLPTLSVYVEERSIPFLEESEVNYDIDNFGGQLTIKAPNARLPNISPDSPLEDRVNYVIYNEINPMLESHGGVVSLKEITKDKFAILQFGGGCQGCSMVDVTLKDGVEKTLLESIPELAGVRDMTDHTMDENAFYGGES
ncbi:MAG: Fe/S biogenesis protein NfuA [SAR86 cluster bacterium BACL1 MAG-121105-bin34]|jgi:Fe/S biogenesis protein NfuA|uniref:Fe/S biogenesis protein NfuA n=1 Tax=SAR86 cluster bacterium BACL1 MAG-120920-bin57 TaxID=1655571 RepID=A0A0R2PQB7_9GAMM|nr:MAG: Fe/S biogenesis protein NfuA [SAR86 cluster bacterium BACL1 MAG-120920-bin57]KRO98917.1 MAG: Fe/S biogenesis protein NfuA [SAR86 cluster bacterium BACL1 MAG-120823-bin87]KRP00320.1 MAG: Fe/S biogenesis protein NfuA [SAR86 cluster bacterium BACL1 MAG-120813-bin36]KRP00590.1 MAG: Fe/S biogenesis protein NfuA [SAR86 cluster bacterium BACL1 MAG-120924-bin88]KRP09148.1 MAG: Fe/S biogenesis protein NfuA [SAR86 cluster bacterium BACL1 MAG-121004-bin11]KRP12967.1 MAG: Fe/S biogenesis protein N